MTELTAAEVQIAARELEQAAASILGRMLFEFSRLDVALGLLLVWADEGSNLHERTERVTDYTLHRKLEFLAELVDRKFKESSKAHSAYSRWLREAHSARKTRNRLVHGRWGVEATRQQITNVMGLPTSPDQNAVSYSLRGLEEVLNSMADLQVDLQKLRTQWPL